MTVHTRPEQVDIPPPNAITASKVDRACLYRRHGKRWLDVALVVLVSPIWVPLVALCAVLVSLDGGRPFYTQSRIGRNARTFRLWKLRTMVPDADSLLAVHLERYPAAREEWAAKQKLRSDPRVTRIGRVLRRSSIDELPQFWNVLRGEMSLVGPRPMMTGQQVLYPGSCYYRLRPGVTGFWQVSNRNECRFRDRARFDNAYCDVLCLRTDLAVLWRTVGAVLRATGH
jgi:lipopolysaccharide/colanic/teichoic acid biosynthesis glycosyltransferase